MSRDDRHERRLVERARLGDRAAQQELWRLHRRWVAAIVLAHRPRTVDVEDLMQDVAVKLVTRIDTLRDVEAFRPWLRQIIINVCRGAARNLRPTLRLVSGERDENDADHVAAVSTPTSTEPSAELLAHRRDTAHRLLEAALSLPPEYREPLMLRCLRSLSYREISELLELPVTTIETRLARARRMLRAEFGEQVEEWAG